MYVGVHICSLFVVSQHFSSARVRWNSWTYRASCDSLVTRRASSSAQCNNIRAICTYKPVRRRTHHTTNPHLALIAALLNRSGSMKDCKKATESGFDEMIAMHRLEQH